MTVNHVPDRSQSEIIADRREKRRQMIDKLPKVERESSYDAYKAGYAAGYTWGYIDGLKRADPDSRMPMERGKAEGQAEMVIVAGALICEGEADI